MTPQDHLYRAEQLLTRAESSDNRSGSPYTMEAIMAALCHALIAHAAESGVFHYSPWPPGGEPGGG